MGGEGYVKIYRKLLDNPLVCKSAGHLAVWVYLLLNATHAEYRIMFEGRPITLLPGQLITSRQAISSDMKLCDSMVQRILKSFEIEHQIEQQTTPRNRLITIVNWIEYQSPEQQAEQQLNNKRTTTEQQLNTNNNVKNIKNKRNIDILLTDKKQYGEFGNVLLSDSDYEKLADDYGMDLAKDYIKKVDIWFGNNPAVRDKRKNHLLTIYTFLEKDNIAKQLKRKREPAEPMLTEEQIAQNRKRLSEILNLDAIGRDTIGVDKD